MAGRIPGRAVPPMSNIGNGVGENNRANTNRPAPWVRPWRGANLLIK
jgi:hypothetical protein